jgi:SAM-dependent methyltransferase
MPGTIQYLPAVPVEGHQSSQSGSPEHPMRIATRRAAGLDPAGWTGELRAQVADFFGSLADEWHTRATPQRIAVVTDALTRGLDPLHISGGLAVESGSGTGIYSGLIAARFPVALAVDLSQAMLEHAPARPAHRVRADASQLPLRDRSAAVVVLVNAFLFPAEIDRVLTADGAIVWVNSSGEYTPIHLSPSEVAAALPGTWSGVASQAGRGLWCVLRRQPLSRV